MLLLLGMVMARAEQVSVLLCGRGTVMVADARAEEGVLRTAGVLQAQAQAQAQAALPRIMLILEMLLRAGQASRTRLFQQPRPFSRHRHTGAQSGTLPRANVHQPIRKTMCRKGPPASAIRIEAPDSCLTAMSQK